MSILLAFEITVRATAVLGIAWLAVLLCGRASAWVRALIWSGALLVVLALPLATVLLRPWSVPVPHASLNLTLPAAPAAPASTPQAAPVSKPSSEPALQPSRWPRGLLAVWLTGFVFFCWRLCASAMRVARITRHARAMAIPESLSRGVRAVQSAAVPYPAAWGWPRSVILLPSVATDWPRSQWKAVLTHELAHIARRDWLIHMLTTLARAVYWFHPLAWYAHWRLRVERELACDDVVLAAGTSPPEYAAQLLNLASIPRSAMPAAAVGMAQTSSLEERLNHMLDSKTRHSIPRPRLAGAALIAGICVLTPLAGIRAQAQAGAASLTGAVTDPSGGRVPNAAVDLRSSGFHGAAITNEAGEYTISGLPAGPYKVQILKPGFAPFMRQGVEVQPGSAVRLDATLNLGRVNETVDVIGTGRRAAPSTNGAPQRIRIGGNVQATRLVSNVKPDYPAELQQQGVEGTVLIQAVIAREGNLLSATVVNAGVHPQLAKAALDAVNQWRYQPTLLNGEPVEVITEITVNFRLPR